MVREKERQRRTRKSRVFVAHTRLFIIERPETVCLAGKVAKLCKKLEGAKFFDVNHDLWCETHSDATSRIIFIRLADSYEMTSCIIRSWAKRAYFTVQCDPNKSLLNRRTSNLVIVIERFKPSSLYSVYKHFVLSKNLNIVIKFKTSVCTKT